MKPFLARFIESKIEVLRTLVFMLLCLIIVSACSTFNPPPPVPMPGPVPTPAPAPTQQDPLAALATFTITDLTNADADAVAHNDTIAHLCYPALIQFIQSLPSSQAGTTVTGAFGAFQKARDIRNAVSGGVPNSVLIGCGPLVTQVRGDILTLLGRLGAGIVTAPLVPIP